MSDTGPAVWIVDDDESVRRALTRLIRAAGFRAEAFASAEDFLRSGRAQDPGCLVLDVRLPGMSGLDLQEHLAAAGLTLPVVFITSYEDPGARARALGAGAVDFLMKPFDEGALLGSIARAVHPAPARPVAPSS